MALILNIDTATEHASVCIANDAKILSVRFNEDAKQHAAFLQPAIESICKEAQLSLGGIDAVAVSNGPGSYTGLRVGLSSAKGICYALNKPLILINTLLVMAEAQRKTAKENYICPMIDARRMEVFTAVYDQELNEIIAPQAMVLTEESYSELLKTYSILFCGSGANKWSKIVQSSNAFFSNQLHDCTNLNSLSQVYYSKRVFADLAYSEPFYIKPFFDTHKL